MTRRDGAEEWKAGTEGNVREVGGKVSVVLKGDCRSAELCLPRLGGRVSKEGFGGGGALGGQIDRGNQWTSSGVKTIERRLAGPADAVL